MRRPFDNNKAVRTVAIHVPSSLSQSELQADTEAGSVPGPDAEVGAMSTSALTRLLQILDWFTLEKTTLKVEEVAQGFGIVQSTAYRYLKELCDAGLLAQQGKGVYSLGRRIVELERLLQLSDPLLLSGKVVLDELLPNCVNRAFLLCTYYKDGVLCVYKIGPDEILFKRKPMLILRGRGTLLPLFGGAGSQVILAHLPLHQLKSLYLAKPNEIAKAGLGESWKAFRLHLADIRKTGHAETVGKMNPGMHSIAVPIMKDDGKTAGSVLMLGSAEASATAEALAMVPLLQDKARRIADALSA